jgi:hypothetical protein
MTSQEALQTIQNTAVSVVFDHKFTAICHDAVYCYIQCSLLFQLKK